MSNPRWNINALWNVKYLCQPPLGLKRPTFPVTHVATSPFAHGGNRRYSTSPHHSCPISHFPHLPLSGCSDDSPYSSAISLSSVADDGLVIFLPWGCHPHSPIIAARHRRPWGGDLAPLLPSPSTGQCPTASSAVAACQHWMWPEAPRPAGNLTPLPTFSVMPTDPHRQRPSYTHLQRLLHHHHDGVQTHRVDPVQPVSRRGVSFGGARCYGGSQRRWSRRL